MIGSRIRRRSGGQRAAGSFSNTDTAPPSLGGGTGCRLYVARGHGLYTDAGSTLVTGPGQTAYRWKDYSGSNNHLDQSTSSWRPVIQSAAQPAFANPTHFDVPSAVGSGVTDGELFGLIKLDTTAVSHGLWWFGGGDIGVISTDGNIYEGSGTTGRYAFARPSGMTAWHVYSVRTSGGTWQALKDNVALDTRASNTPSWSSGYLGADLALSLFLTGQISACAFFDGARSSGERSSIVTALLAQAPA